MSSFLWLDQLSFPDQTGDKAFRLGQLAQKGYTVVPGFVLPSSVYQEFWESQKWSDPLLTDLFHSSFHLQVEDSCQLQAVARRLRRGVLDADLPETWVEEWFRGVVPWQAPALLLRPSLHIPGPGDKQLQGLLRDQVCLPQLGALSQGVKLVWAEIFRAASLVCWQRRSLQLTQLQLGVIIQPLLPVVSSGVLTLESATNAQVQAIQGLSLALSQGEVIPDLYHLHRGQVISQHLGRQTLAYGLEPRDFSQNPLTPLPARPLSGQQDFVLTPQQLGELGRLVARVSQDFAPPYSLEWLLRHNQPALLLTEFSPCSPTTRQWTGIGAAPGRRLAPAVVVSTPVPGELPPGSILVARDIPPPWLPWLTQVGGIVTEGGGIASHGGILARDLGVPAVVGVVGITDQVRTGELLLVDGDRGEVSRGVEPPPPTSPNPLPSLTPGPRVTQLLVTINQVQALGSIRQEAVDGVGLVRSELMLLGALEGQHPQEWVRQGRQNELRSLITNRLEPIARAFDPRPVFYRTLDLRSHEFQHLEGAPAPELNPALGNRGTLAYCQDPQLFDIEVAALMAIHNQGHHNLHLLLPLVRTVEEFRFCQQRVASLPLWLMAEVPSVLFLLPEYVAAGAQGIAIGTNDLHQFLFALDRDGPQPDQQNLNPAFTAALNSLVCQSRQLGIRAIICGDAVRRHPELIDLLVSWGIWGISVDLPALEVTRRALSRAEQRLLLPGAWGQNS